MAKILVIDDEPDILELTGLLLERGGHEMVGAQDGESAMQMLKNEVPDLILLDVRMPDMDGWEFCRMLKSDGELKHIPLVMFTVRSSAEDKERSWESGADAQLDKPFTRKELCEKINALCFFPDTFC